MSINDNVLAGVKLNNKRISKSDADDLVEKSLRGANLWNEVKDRLDQPGSGLSGGQQQRLCIARAIAVSPDVLLMDEPCSALDPISTLAIEDLIEELKNDYTIVIVTHNMQQASRVSDRTAFFNIAGTGKPGKLIEYDDTDNDLLEPDACRPPRTTSPAASADRAHSPPASQGTAGQRQAREMPGRRTPLGARPLEAANIGARGYCGPASTSLPEVRGVLRRGVRSREHVDATLQLAQSSDRAATTGRTM